MRVWLVAGAVGGLGALLSLRPALADAIDGHWCHMDGRRLEIAGPAIVTPAKTRTQGQYDRHYFTYTAPAADPGAGTTIDLTLINETTVRLKPGDGAEEIWSRCGPPISQYGPAPGFEVTQAGQVTFMLFPLGETPAPAEDAGRDHAPVPSRWVPMNLALSNGAPSSQGTGNA